MNFYFDIVLRPKKNIKPNQLLSKVYKSLHLELVKLKSDDIGVSFPEAQRGLGEIIRVHGQEEKLTLLLESGWIQEYQTSCYFSQVSEIPSDTKFRKYSRIQPVHSISKFKRLEKRGSQVAFKDYMADMAKDVLNNPYITLKSESTGKIYKKFIKIGNIESGPISGQFDTFGLSHVGNVPVF